MRTDQDTTAATIPTFSTALPSQGFDPGAERQRRHGPVCFDGDVPLFVERALEQLHGSIYSCALRARVDGWVHLASSYVFLHRGEPRTALLYRVQGRTLTVLTEVFTINAHDIAVFAQYMLRRYRQVAVIRFRSIDTDLALLGMPMLKVPVKEDIVVEVPADPQQYWSSLGKTSRQNIKYYRNKLEREQGEFTVSIHTGDEIARSAFDEVLHLSRARMQSKGKTYGIRNEHIEQSWRFTQVAGMVLRVMVKGRIVAGSICMRAGENWHLDTIGHDPAMNEYRLGTLCCLLTIQECIRRGARQFHFLWGQYDYKYRFMGKERKLYDVAIYRSRSSMALQPGAMLSVWSSQARSRTRAWLAARQRPASL